jgi:hypothetical protein
MFLSNVTTIVKYPAFRAAITLSKPESYDNKLHIIEDIGENDGSSC